MLGPDAEDDGVPTVVEVHPHAVATKIKAVGDERVLVAACGVPVALDILDPVRGHASESR